MVLIHWHKFVEQLKVSPARKNKIIIISAIIGLIVNITIWGLIYFKFYPTVYSLPPEQSFIPLHYNIYLGIDLFGAWQKIFIFPGLGLAILVLNTILALIIFNKREIASYFLTIGGMTCQFFLLISTILAILINI